MIWSFDKPKNEMDSPLLCRSGADEKKMLIEAIDEMRSETVDVPIIINGSEYRTDDILEIRAPHDRSLLLAKAHLANDELIEKAISGAMAAWSEWSKMEWYHRAAIFRKAADLLSSRYRMRNLAATMLNLSKNPHEAEIDLAELVDLWRFNTYYMRFIYEQQPDDAPGEKNRMDWRPLEGFVLALPPFNFTSIAGNLATAPALMGNVVLWKPSKSVVMANYEIMKVLMDAGLPPGVINFVPFRSEKADLVLTDKDLAGVHFTGSYPTLTKIWRTVGASIENYTNFPRIIGEAGGKGFIIMHSSADLKNTVSNVIRGAFGYQGQKCSAASRLYVPERRWEEVKDLLVREQLKIKMGAPDKLEDFMGAVIDREAFERIGSYIDHARKKGDNYEIVCGGGMDARKGYFIEPTVIRSLLPRGKLMIEEIFGPVLTVFVYPDDKFQDILRIANDTSPYALTGAIFAEDRSAICEAESRLRQCAGNFYINDKPTGAVVNRQPFGGTRHSGTDDKAGSWLNLLRWTAPRTIKESTVRIDDWKYPFMN